MPGEGRVPPRRLEARVAGLFRTASEGFETVSIATHSKRGV